MTEITNSVILNSQAFNVINHMIDEKAEELKGMLFILKDRVDQAFRPDQVYRPNVDTRIHEEDQCRGSVELPASVNSIKELTWYIEQVQLLETEIGNLQRQKLRLMNDWDFTHGNDAEQKKIFG
jgi:hypothetical protein